MAVSGRSSAGREWGLSYAPAIIRGLGGKVTPEKLKFFKAWAQAEGTQAAYNPFATTRKGYPGETSFNPVGVKNYPDARTGIKATIDTLQLSYYTGLTNLIRDPSATAEDLARAVANSPWGTGTGVLRVLGSTRADSFEQSVSKAKYGQQKVQLEQQYPKMGADLFRPSEAYVSMMQRLSPGVGRLAAGYEPLGALVPSLNAPGTGGDVGTPVGDVANVAPIDMVMTGDNIGARAVKAAATQLGKPYVFGSGPSTESFDCSDLVQWSYAQLGIAIPRDTYGQQEVLKPKDWSDLRVGDPIYRRSGGHVVIYAGNGRVIAAPHSGTVVQYQPLSNFSQEEYVPYSIPHNFGKKKKK
jgi:peptidoglycan DL-endopeptidase CwlO